MWDDPIVQEIREIRKEHASRFNFNLQAIAEDLKKHQKDSGKTFISLQPKKPTALSKLKTKHDAK